MHTLADFGCGTVQFGHRAIHPDREGDPGLRKVVEAFAVGDVLVAHREADPSPQPLPASHVAGHASRKGDRIAAPVRVRRLLFGEGDRGASFDDLADRSASPNDLSGWKDRAVLQCIHRA